MVYPGDSGERTGLHGIRENDWLVEEEARDCLVLKAKEVRLFWGNLASVPLHLVLFIPPLCATLVDCDVSYLSFYGHHLRESSFHGGCFSAVSSPSLDVG